MGKIKVESCEIEGLKVITPTVFGDERGYFMETYNYNDFKEAGIEVHAGHLFWMQTGYPVRTGHQCRLL